MICPHMLNRNVQFFSLRLQTSPYTGESAGNLSKTHILPSPQGLHAAGESARAAAFQQPTEIQLPKIHCNQKKNKSIRNVKLWLYLNLMMIMIMNNPYGEVMYRGNKILSYYWTSISSSDSPAVCRKWIFFFFLSFSHFESTFQCSWIWIYEVKSLWFILPSSNLTHLQSSLA